MRTIFFSVLIAALAAGCSDKSGNAHAAEVKDMVRVRVFDEQGRLVGPVEMPKVVKSDAEWKKILTPEQYRISRGKDTERPFCGTLLDNHMDGVYTCVSCGLPLFASNAKFNSGTGWPSFFQPVAPENVVEHKDSSLGMVRTEILCARCDGHLGHVFDDGPRPTGLRFCVNSESLKFTRQEQIKTLADPAAPKAPATQPVTKAAPKVGDRLPAPAVDLPGGTGGRAEAVFAGGCFWCVEGVFEEVNGVSDAESGYAGGSAQTAHYDVVSGGHTGHAEAVRIVYDPAKVTYGQLLRIFFATHDPTSLYRQGPDEGTQYRSAIFYANDDQKRVAEAYIKQLADAHAFKQPIVTRLEPLKAFYPAEKYHQDFVRHNPDHPYIRAWALPKIEKLKHAFPDEVKAPDDAGGK